MKRATSNIMFTFLLASMLTLSPNIQPIKASGTIYIRADGSVEGTTHISSLDNDTYTFTDNIYDEIVVERDNIVVDGAGYAIQGAGGYNLKGIGIDLTGRSNTTIKNMEIKQFLTGIQLDQSSNNIIQGNDIKNNSWGIYLVYSSSNTISGNNIEANRREGIELIISSNNNTIYGNNIANTRTRHGILFRKSSNYNSISGNNIASNDYGIFLYESSHNNFFKNSITNNRRGIMFERRSSYNNLFENNIKANSEFAIVLQFDGSNNRVYLNNITNNGWGSGLNDGWGICGGIFLWVSSYNKIYRNNFIDNAHQIVINYQEQPIITWDDDYPLGGNYWSDYDGTDEKCGLNQDQLGRDGIGDTPYIIDMHNQDRYPVMHICEAWIPTLILVSTSSPSTLLGYTANITGTLYDTYGNRLKNKTIVLYYTFLGANTWVPISSDNTDNLGHYSVMWIPPATGYFTIKAEWAGNTTHFTSSNNVNLNTILHENRYIFSVESNSTISALAFNMTSHELSFSAGGPSGTRGYVKTTIAKTLVKNIADVKVYIDGDKLNYTITSSDDSWLLHFTYLHSTHKMTIILGDISIPFIETPLGKTAIYIVLIITLTTLTLLYALKKKKRSH